MVKGAVLDFYVQNSEYESSVSPKSRFVDISLISSLRRSKSTPDGST